MHRKFDVRRIFTAFFVGVFAVAGTIVAIEAPAKAAIDTLCPVTSSTVSGSAAVDSVALNGTCYVTFKNTGAVGTQNEITWTKPAGLNFAKVLVVAGGGGGGAHVGAGGGAGGLVDQSSVRLSGSTYSIRVGQGGRGAYTNPGGDVNQGPDVYSWSTSGADSSFGALFTAVGGGRGAAWWNTGPGGGESFTAFGNNAAGTGGSGGGAVRQTGAKVNGASTTQAAPGYGFAGGATGDVANGDADGYLTGGGGGAGGVGGDAIHTAPKHSGNGGPGRAVTWLPTAVSTSLAVGQISSSAVYFAGGGGGGMHTKVTGISVGTGGVGGGGAGAAPVTEATNESIVAASGLAATGGGGGGAGGVSAYSVTSTGGAGGSGVVVISYPVSAVSSDDNYLNLNGTSQYAVATGAQVIPATGAFTVEAWVNATSSGASTYSLIASQGTGANRFYVKRYGGNLMAYRDQDSATTEVTCGALPADQWVHIALSFDATIVNCFVNGTKIFTSAFAWGNKSVGTGFYVGQYSAAPSDASSYFKGGIDQVKIWNTAITDAAIIARSMHMHADTDSVGTVSGLTNLYDFNESSSSSTVSDIVGNTSLSATNAPSRSPIAVTTTVSGNTVYTFKRSYLTGRGGWVAPSGLTSGNTTLLAVGGGGSGGTRHAGGGGAGALLYDTAWSATAGNVLTMKVGQGGLGRPGGSNRSSNVLTLGGLNGQSTIAGSSVLNGGGAGEGGVNAATAGGSSGGRDESGAVTAVGAGIGFKNTGAAGALINNGNSWVGGGGGGAGSAGYLGTNAAAGSGGDGREYSITGTPFCYAAGGGGGSSWASAAGGAGGDGCANAAATGGVGSATLTPGPAATAATANSGSGGGAGGFDQSGYVDLDSGSGGSGVIIVAVRSTNTVTFNANTGTGTMANQVINSGDSANLTANSFTRTGYAFKGWSTTANGTLAYSNAQSVTPTSDLSLYAIWVKQVLYYNFSDRDSTHGGTTTVTNLADTATLAGTKINAPTHNYTNGTLNLTGTTYANGSYVDVADIATAQFGSGITVDFEVDFGSSVENWERVLDFGVSGQATSNILVSRRAASSDIVFEIYNGSTSQGHCYVVGGIPASAQMIRWTFSLDGTNCYVWKDGVAQVTTTTSVANSYATVQTSAFAYLPANNVTWASNFIGKSNWSADAAAKMAVRSLRIYAGAMTADQVGSISYRTVNFDGNYTGSAAIESRYTSGKTTLQDGPNRSGFTFGGWYDNAVSASGTLIGSSGAVYSPVSTPMNLYASWTSAMPSVNVQFDELNFDYSNVVHIVGTNGKALNNKVLFLNVTTKGGVQVDALVTTQTLSNATIANYEASTGAGGANSYFQADVDISAANGFAEFKFDFYQHGAAGSAGNPCAPTTNTTCVGATKVKLQNVNISAIDIDYYQWNDFTAVESYTVAGNSQTKLKECEIPGSGTCAARTAPATFPANMRFQGSADTARTNDPVDMAIVTYAEIETFRIKFGRSATGKPNYYGVAFKALPWGVQTPASVGGTTYSVNYNGNGSTVGNNPTSSTGVVGSNVTLPGAGTLTKTGYSFAGWNTLADGTGTTYAAGNVIQMPQGGTTLYAKWTAIQYMLIYKLYGGVNGPATEMRYTGAVANLSAIQPVRDGNYFHSWNTLADGTGTTYAPSDSFTMPGANTTLHAMWGVATGTVAYNANNGSNAPASTSGTSGANATAAAVGSMTRANYTFSGWNTAANGSGTDYTVGASVPYPGNGQTTTLYAQWTPVLYSYSYNANGGSGAPTGGSTTAGSTVTIASSTTTRTGYTFAGWTTAADGTGTVYSNGGANPSLTMPSSNTVLYAKWTAISYNLSFNSNDARAGANPATATGTYGSTQNVAAAPSAPTNKKFNGWNTEQNGSGSTYAASSTYQLTADQTLYAQWVADTVNLFYSANGGSGAPTSTTATANVDVTLSGTAPQRTGFEFSGWTTAQNGTGTVYGVSSTFPLGNTDTTLYAKWTPIGYNFIYSANGGSGAPATVAYNMGQFVVINSGGTVERTGYTFAGWNTLADGNGSDYIGGQNFLMSDSNMTMYAKWTSNPYTLTYNGNGGTGSPAPETRNAGAVANLSATAPTRDGYTFNGWNSALNGSGTNYAASSSFTMPTSNSTIYAQWVLNSNAVSYNANNGSGAPTGGTYNYAATVTVSSATPTRVGYTFLGWNTQADGNGTNYAAADTFSMPNASVVLYARWAVQQKIFTYDANGGAGVEAAANYNYGATVTVTSTQPNRAGYSFIGWNSMADGSGTASAASSTFTMPASDVTVYAIWSVNAYTVYYNMNGGSGSINPQPGTYGTNVIVSSTAPTRIGFTFSGWNTLPDGTGSDHTGGGSLTIPSNNLTLYAKWTAIQYSISYNANGGSGSPADVTALTAGTNTTLSATAPTRDGYVFNGWNTAVNGSGQTYAGGQSYVVPAANTVLYAQWVANTYEVIYNANGGTGAPAAENGSTGQSVNLSGTSPTRPGYSFVRWNTDISDTNTGTRYAPGGPFSVPAGNTILYAIWDLADITLTYNINGGAGTTPATVTDKFMAAVTLSPASAFSRSGYTFNGWNTAADGSGASYAAESNFVLPDANEELFAQWSQIFYAVEYNTNGGANAPANQFAAPGTNVSIAPTEPTKAGYVFDDWTSAGAGTTVTPGATLTMPSSNVVLVANWVTRATVPSGQTNGGVASPSPSPSGTPSPSATPAPKKLSQTVYFKGDSAVLQPAAKTQLRAVAKKAKAYGTAAKIQVYGRVKETNDKSYDLRLSRARANNVAKYLKSLGVKGVWVITAAGISPENKAISRRVDLYMNWK